MNYREYFTGSVPEKLKTIAICIMQRFTIYGICDPMYICNVIAVENGIGDGVGGFTGDEIKYPEKTAKILQDCYGCNIGKDDIEELKDIIVNGRLDDGKAICGIEKYIAKCMQEKDSTDDEWRKEYLGKCISEAVAMLEAFKFAGK